MGGVSGLRSAFREKAEKRQTARAMTAIDEGSTATLEEL